jgi:hypothetical protein
VRGELLPAMWEKKSPGDTDLVDRLRRGRGNGGEDCKTKTEEIN